ncbi:MAG: hypothetical protein NTX50_32250 [Candidatus Sumerlaeota bacterium]|nr:hypothetical protein [Candidatus Sumerlaeota bacterium]
MHRIRIFSKSNAAQGFIAGFFIWALAFVSGALAVVPEPKDTPVEIIVSGRTSTLQDITIVNTGLEIPQTYAGARVKNTPGFTWYVSQHFALKTDLREDEARYYLTVAELAYPHYKWVFGFEPPDIDHTRLAFVYASDLPSLQKCVRTDMNTFWAGNGGGVTLNNKVAYNYPSGSLRYHKRDLVIHENLHLYQMCALGDYYMPARFIEGITHAFSNHVYDEDKKQLTVRVLDKATTNNPYDKALDELKHKRFIPLSEMIDKGSGDGPVWALAMQFFWTNPDRLMKWRLWRDEMLRLKEKKDYSAADRRLMQEILGPLDALDAEWKQWVEQHRSTFHYAAWGWEQSGNTLWSYGFGKQRYSRTDINYLPCEKVEYDPLRMDYPMDAMPAIVGPVARGAAEPSVGVVVDFSRNPQRGVAGMALGVAGEKLLAVLVDRGEEITIDGGDLGAPKRSFPLSPEFKDAMGDSSYRAGLTLKIAAQALEVTARAGNEICAPLTQMTVSYPLTPDQRRLLMERPMAIIAMYGKHGVTPFFDDARRPDPDLMRPAPMGRWRFAGEDILYQLYRAVWRLGKDAPPSLISTKDQLANAEDKDPATQQAALNGAPQLIDCVRQDIAVLMSRGGPVADKAAKALAELSARKLAE